MPITADDERVVRRIAREVAGEVFDARLPDVERTIVTAVGARFNEALAPLKQQSADVATMKTALGVVQGDVHEVKTAVDAYGKQNEQQTQLFIQLAEAKGRLAQIDVTATREFDVEKVAITAAVGRRTALLAFLGVCATALAALITAALMSSRPR